MSEMEKENGVSDIVEYPEKIMLRDTVTWDDMGGLGQRIYTNAGAGYKKVEYVRGDIVESLRQRVKELEGYEQECANLDAELKDYQNCLAELAALKAAPKPEE